MLVKGLKDEDAFSQDGREHNENHVAAIASREQFFCCAGMRFVILHKIADNQIRIDQPPAAHFAVPRRRVARAAAFRI